MSAMRIKALPAVLLTCLSVSSVAFCQAPGGLVTEESVLAELGLPPIRLGTRTTYARPFADIELLYEQTTYPAAELRRAAVLGEGQPARAAERMTLAFDLGADGRHRGWRRELLGLGFTLGGRNASWDGDFFEPLAAAESTASLRLGGVKLLCLEAEQELAVGRIVERRLASMRRSFRLGPVKVRASSKVYAALGVKLGGTVLFSAPGEAIGSDLGIGATLAARAGAAVSGRISAGTRRVRVGGTASFDLIDALDQFSLTARQSGVDAQLRLEFEALSARLRVWVKAWFFRASRTLLNWRLGSFERVFDLA